MRRGKLNKTSYIILLASAIFTILAYVSDQVVINKQNKSRILDLEYNKLVTNISSLERFNSTISNIGFKKDSLISTELKKRNFFLKNLSLFNLKKEEDISVLLKGGLAINNIKIRAINSTRNLMYDISDISIAYTIALENEFFDQIEDFSKKKFIDNLENIVNPEKLYNDNLDIFWNKDYKDFDDKLFTNGISKNYEIKDWFSFRNFKLLLLENFYKETEKMYKVGEYIDEKIINNEEDLNNILLKIKKNNTIKNYFILTGIISQILTLFFLLLLFRSLIKQKIF
tara:strand:+ start:1121 stop:1975 length:855 start_codon:yes stop_codon:yes gene_type:complete